MLVSQLDDAEIGRAHVNSSHMSISYAVFCWKKKNKRVLPEDSPEQAEVAEDPRCSWRGGAAELAGCSALGLGYAPVSGSGCRIPGGPGCCGRHRWLS